jgi:hypothetical protein
MTSATRALTVTHLRSHNIMKPQPDLRILDLRLPINLS